MSIPMPTPTPSSSSTMAAGSPLGKPGARGTPVSAVSEGMSWSMSPWISTTGERGRGLRCGRVGLRRGGAGAEEEAEDAETPVTALLTPLCGWDGALSAATGAASARPCIEAEDAAGAGIALLPAARAAASSLASVMRRMYSSQAPGLAFSSLANSFMCLEVNM
jgi:hypothetical protein